MRNLDVAVFFVIFLLCCGVVTQSEASDVVKEKIHMLQKYVDAEEYEQAYNLVGVLRTDLYERMVMVEEPELLGNTYRNYYYQFSVVNPVTEWELEEVRLLDKAAQRKRQLMRDLVKIKNVSSPYGMTEQIVISVYDVGKSPDAGLVEELDFKPRRYLKMIAEKIIVQRAGVDTELIEKDMRTLGGNHAYFVVTETDMGFEKAIRLINCYIYVEQKQYVLIFSFVMHSENYPVYKYVFDEILEQVKLGAIATNDVLTVEQKSFMDIYLERSKKAV